MVVVVVVVHGAADDSVRLLADGCAFCWVLSG